MSITPNTIPGGTFSGSFYCYPAAGGFYMERSFDTIEFQTQTDIITYDTTDAVQVNFDVRTFNTKLGLVKDTNNITILETSYNDLTDVFPNDSITITAAEFVSGMAVSQVISVGTYSTLYSDFVTYVQTYFGYAGGFASLFQDVEQFDINGGVFDASAFVTLITEEAASGDGAYINELSGNIVISDINQMLRYAVDANPFNNRDASDGTTAGDPSDNSNYGVADGFYENDLIWVPGGTTIQLSLGIDVESFADPLNNVGPEQTSALTASSNWSITNFSRTTTASVSQIQRTLTAPLLIRLENLS